MVDSISDKLNYPLVELGDLEVDDAVLKGVQSVR